LAIAYISLLESLPLQEDVYRVASHLLGSWLALESSIQTPARVPRKIFDAFFVDEGVVAATFCSGQHISPPSVKTDLAIFPSATRTLTW
jgi:hypothetical protein